MLPLLYYSTWIFYQNIIKTFYQNPFQILSSNRDSDPIFASIIVIPIGLFLRFVAQQ